MSLRSQDLRWLAAYGRFLAKVDQRLALHGALPTEAQQGMVFKELMLEDPEMLDIARDLGLDTETLMEFNPPARIVSERIYRETFDGVWPFTVEWGTLSCQAGAGSQAGAVTFTAPDGTVYGIGGGAMDRLGAASVDPIWLENPDGPAPRVTLNDIDAAARRLWERET